MTPNSPRDSHVSRKANDVPPWLGWLFIAAGLAIEGLALGIIPSDPAKFHAPKWIVGVCGLVFATCGFKLLTIDRPELSRWVGPVLVACFGVIGLWIGLFGEAEAFGGGSALVSAETNVSAARLIFGGIGALLLMLLPVMLYNWRSLR